MGFLLLLHVRTPLFGSACCCGRARSEGETRVICDDTSADWLVIKAVLFVSDAQYSGLKAQTCRVLPQLLSGDEHLGQPLQLCSLLLHGVPDPVHLPANTWCTNKQPHARTHKHTQTHDFAWWSRIFSVHFKRHQFKNNKHTEVRGVQTKRTRPCSPFEHHGEPRTLVLPVVPSWDENRVYCSTNTRSVRRRARSSITLPALPRKRAGFHPDARMRALFPV